MFAKEPSHAPALGLNPAGPIAGLPEHHPRDRTPSNLDPLIFPNTGAAPFKVMSDINNETTRQQTQNPYITSSSVVAVKFDTGVAIAADTLASLGGTLRYKNIQRVHKVNDTCIIGAGGEMSDYAYIRDILNDFTMEDFCADDGMQLTPSEVYSILCRILYNRRTKMDPLWNSVIVGGIENGKAFLGTVGMIGIHYADDHITTGFGHHLMKPILRELYRPSLTKDEAIEMLKTCLSMGYYRDATTINKFQIAVCSSEGLTKFLKSLSNRFKGITISEPFALDAKWDYEKFVHPTLNAPTSF